MQRDVDSNDNWLDDVRLLHNALPEIDFRKVETKLEFMDKELSLPLVIAGMTGGAEEVTEVNKTLAGVAEKKGLAFGLGSMKAMLEDPSLSDTYKVRDVAPKALLLGNLGVSSLKDFEKEEIEEAVEKMGVDALCVHLNAPQEYFQKSGESDLDWSESFDLLKDARKICPVIAKEVGFGVSRETAERLKKAKVSALDLGGYGGTNWIYVEGLRTGKNTEVFRDWGIPTAASITETREVGLPLIATGGIRTGLDVAKSLALGANLCGAALPFLKAFNRGEEAVMKYVEKLESELKASMFFTNSKNLEELSEAKYVLSGRLKNWTDQRTS